MALVSPSLANDNSPRQVIGSMLASSGPSSCVKYICMSLVQTGPKTRPSNIDGNVTETLSDLSLSYCSRQILQLSSGDQPNTNEPPQGQAGPLSKSSPSGSIRLSPTSLCWLQVPAGEPAHRMPRFPSPRARARQCAAGRPSPAQPSQPLAPWNPAR